jgi:hypothetical protein
MMKSNLTIKVLLVSWALAASTFAEDFLNIRTDPVMVLGNTFVNLEIDIRVSENWSVGAIAQADTDQPTFNAGLRAIYYEEGVFQTGWMTGLEVNVGKVVSDDLYYDSAEGAFCYWDSALEAEVCDGSPLNELGVSVDHGYFWRWGTFNAGMGAGMKVISNETQWSDVGIIPALHFSIGWAR